ncbi:ABC transporter permease [Archangium lansingense]|uniref:ABC transporter permease n=1 Tax=Archangium lansingense TaxID=2995310 RepID=A0ABT4AH79_9BACT|nr:ABC transporter permease [Archangium lansinium]MCY1081032.1 ABC transporter permease [Archangium lansinium]
MGERLRAVLPSIFSVFLALAVCWGFIALTRDPEVASEAYLQMLRGGLGDWSMYLEGGRVTVLTRPIGEAAIKAALLLLTGLSVTVAFKVGLFNIGAQGQMLVGALAAAVVGAQLSLPAVLHIPAAVLAACMAGGLWALIAAALKLTRGVHEVISTIMLNWVAVSLVDNWLAVGPLRAGAGTHLSTTGTAEIATSAQLPRLLGEMSRLHLGFPLALAVALAIWVWLSRLRSGFETRAVGLGSEAARAAGIPVARRTAQAMGLAGALAGMAGAVLVLGTEYKYPGSLGAPYGFDGIAISLIGGNHPLGVALSALFFGALRAGGTRMQLLGVHKSYPELIQGLALLFVAGRLVWLSLLRPRKVVPVAPQKQPAPSPEVPRA